MSPSSPSQFLNTITDADRLLQTKYQLEHSMNELGALNACSIVSQTSLVNVAYQKQQQSKLTKMQIR